MQLNLCKGLARHFAKKNLKGMLRQNLDDPEFLNNEATSKRRTPGANKFERIDSQTPMGRQSITAEYMGAESHSKSAETEKIRTLSSAPSRISSALDDFLTSNNRSEALARSERLLESVRRGDYRLFSETSDAEFADFHHRFDVYRENFIAQESNNKTKTMDAADDRMRFEAKRDLGMMLRFEEIVGAKYGVANTNMRPEHDGYTLQEKQYNERAKQTLREIPVKEDEEIESEAPSIEFEPDPTYEGMGFEEKDQLTRKRTTVEERLAEVEGRMRTLDFLHHEDMDLFREVNQSEQLSLRARLGVYQCYLEGWTVREISIRYGILPNRVKGICWQMQNFIEEYLPDLQQETLIEMLQVEMVPRHDYKYVDYGIDLERMAKEQEGELSYVYGRDKMGPRMRPNWQLELTEKEIKDGLKPLVMKREDFVIEGFKQVGRNKRPYIMKNWVIHRGKGSLRVNRMFQRILERSHMTDILPGTVVKRLKYGPRIASQGDHMR